MKRLAVADSKDEESFQSQKDEWLRAKQAHAVVTTSQQDDDTCYIHTRGDSTPRRIPTARPLSLPRWGCGQWRAMARHAFARWPQHLFSQSRFDDRLARQPCAVRVPLVRNRKDKYFLPFFFVTRFVTRRCLCRARAPRRGRAVGDNDMRENDLSGGSGGFSSPTVHWTANSCGHSNPRVELTIITLVRLHRPRWCTFV